MFCGRLFQCIRPWLATIELNLGFPNQAVIRCNHNILIPNYGVFNKTINICRGLALNNFCNLKSNFAAFKTFLPLHCKTKKCDRCLSKCVDRLFRCFGQIIDSINVT